MAAQLNSLLVQATDDTVLWNVPQLSHEDGWHLGHLFAGGFAGWTQASDFIIHDNVDQVTISSQVAVELDMRTSYAWSATFGHELLAAPGAPTSFPPGGHFRVCGSVREKTLLTALTFTLFPPCPAWSKGGKSTGPYATDGWDFLEVTQLCLMAKLLACTFGCSDDVRKHPHFVHIQHAMQIAGFRNVLSQNVSVHELSHNLRTRWFGIS